MRRCASLWAGSPARSTSLPLHTAPGTRQRLWRCPASVTSPAKVLGRITDFRELKNLTIDSPELSDLELRDVRGMSYVSRRRLDEDDFDPDAVDDEGLPLVYNEAKIASFWGNRPGELAGRWVKFTAISVPWLTKLTNAFIQNKLGQASEQASLARDAVDNLEKLGPTFIKLGQILSIRPDVLPPAVMKELAKLQDRISPFDTQEARQVVEAELGRPIEDVFSDFSDEPIGAASLAQVYRARLRSNGQEVAVKVQRPGALSTISKDLYVLRRAAGVYESLVKRFTAQTTDYQGLLSTYAEGLYTEMDFRNEALNAARMRELMDASEFGIKDIVIPQPIMELTTRRVMTMEWVSGVKLTQLPPDEIRSLVKVGQEAFLTQLLEIGFFHGDPHPGNLLKVTEGPYAGKLALLDFGLVAEIPAKDRQAMVSATIHLANRDWDALIGDFIALGFLPRETNRAQVTPVMERVLGPYLRGGGAKAFNFQALSQDLLSVTLEIPFSVPPYMSLLARSVATLEGIALLGDENYQMVKQAYPFVARKVLRNDSRNSALLLRDMLYDREGGVKATRLSAMLNAALGYVADRSDGFVDFDAVPEDGASLQELLGFLLSREARELRPVLISELINGLDLFARDRSRRAFASLPSLMPRLPFLPPFPLPPLPPVFVPGRGLMAAEAVLEMLAPPLSQEEEVYLQTVVELVASLMGVKPGDLEASNPSAVLRLLLNPNDQMRELQAALTKLSGSSANAQVVQEVASEMITRLADRQAQRAGVPADTLFPPLPLLRRTLQQLTLAQPSSSSTTMDDPPTTAAAGSRSSNGGTSPAAAAPSGTRLSTSSSPTELATAVSAAATVSASSSNGSSPVVEVVSSSDVEEMSADSEVAVIVGSDGTLTVELEPVQAGSRRR